MRVLITGKDGLIGKDCILEAENRGYEVIPCGRSQFDITNFNDTENFFLKKKPDAVIHMAALHSIDYCEQNPEITYNVNVAGTRNILLACRKSGCKTILFTSSAYVFDGNRPPDEPYTEFDFPNPINISGKSKLAAEELIKSFGLDYFIIRLPLLYGDVNRPGLNPIYDILEDINNKGFTLARHDEFVSISYTKHVVQPIISLLDTSLFGTYHVSNQGFCSRYDFAYEFLEQTGRDTSAIKKVSINDINRPGKRSPNTTLKSIAFLNTSIPSLTDWKNALHEALQTMDIKSIGGDRKK